MFILPIKSIREDESQIFGTQLINLSKLANLGIPVAEGLAFSPPDLELKTILKHYALGNKEVFEQRLELIKSEVKKIPIPEELLKEAEKRKLDPGKLWNSLLQVWFEQLRLQIWNYGFSKELGIGLFAQSVFFTGKVETSGEAFFNYPKKQVEIEIYEGSLTESQRERLIEIVEKARKKLFLPYLYHFIVERNTLKIVKIIPFDEDPKAEAEVFHPSEKPSFRTENVIKSSIKVFLEMDERSYRVDQDIDGIILNSEKITDYETKISQFVEAGKSFLEKPIIFKFSDIKTPNFPYGGMSGILMDKKLLEEDTSIFKFGRHKKSLLNAQLALPFAKTSQQLMEVKRELSGKDLSRKGSLKFWLELATPENIVNIESYLDVGIDGALINLEKLFALFNGFISDGKISVSDPEMEKLLAFLTPTVKLLHKQNIPVILTSSYALSDAVLKFIVERGIWGISTNLVNSYSLHEHLYWLQKRHIRKQMSYLN